MSDGIITGYQPPFFYQQGPSVFIFGIIADEVFFFLLRILCIIEDRLFLICSNNMRFRKPGERMSAFVKCTRISMAVPS